MKIVLEIGLGIAAVVFLLNGIDSLHKGFTELASVYGFVAVLSLAATIRLIIKS